MADDVVLRVISLAKAYGEITALAGVSFEIGKGEVYGLLGPNGAGKSTAILIISTLVAPQSGVVFVKGAGILAEPHEAKRMLGVIPQEVSLYDELTGRENLEFFGALYGLGGAFLKTRAREVIELVGLTGDAHRRLGTYSGGMKRRINIGAGLMHSPPLVLLDEPTVGVDPQSRLAIFDLILQLKAAGTSFLYTTHYMEEAERLCDRIGIIDRGKLIAEGTLRELLARVSDLDRVEIELKPTCSRATETVHSSSAGEPEPFGDETKSRLAAILAHFSPSFENGTLVLATLNASEKLPNALAILASDGFEVRSVKVREPDLESVFIHLTGRKLGDGDA
jgi:ABC-2 type transport system ATP-binding protein